MHWVDLGKQFMWPNKCWHFMAIYMSITFEGGGLDANSCVILSPGYFIRETGIRQNAFSAQIVVIQLFCDCQIKTTQKIFLYSESKEMCSI